MVEFVASLAPAKAEVGAVAKADQQEQAQEPSPNFSHKGLS